jgi:hypothetical protein
MGSRQLNAGSGMGLRVPRSILLVENCSLMRLWNYAKGVMKRTVCADMPRYEQISEKLLFRLDAPISAQAPPEILENPMSNTAKRDGVSDQRSRTAISLRRRTSTLPTSGPQKFIPRQTFVPRNVKSVETLVHLWRKGDVSIGCPIALLNLQSGSMRKQVISGYHNSWWVSRNHKDAMARYSLIIAAIVSMNNDQINKKDEGLDEHWKSALILYHQKWDVFGILPSISTLIEKLRKKE